MKTKPTYTTKLHAYRLSLMLKRDEPYGCCPAAPKFNGSLGATELWEGIPCEICTSFIGLKGLNCPCIQLKRNEDKAIAQSHKALREYYKKGK